MPGRGAALLRRPYKKGENNPMHSKMPRLQWFNNTFILPGHASKFGLFH
jgi:hypothetical protein